MLNIAQLLFNFNNNRYRKISPLSFRDGLKKQHRSSDLKIKAYIPIPMGYKLLSIIR